MTKAIFKKVFTTNCQAATGEVECHLNATVRTMKNNMAS